MGVDAGRTRIHVGLRTRMQEMYHKCSKRPRIRQGKRRGRMMLTIKRKAATACSEDLLVFRKRSIKHQSVAFDYSFDTLILAPLVGRLLERKLVDFLFLF
jgi:hypothetical protein